MHFQLLSVFFASLPGREQFLGQSTKLFSASGEKRSWCKTYVEEETVLATSRTASLFGLERIPVFVEGRVAESSGDKPTFQIIGMGDTAVREARERVSTAIRTLGISLPQNVLINLSPAEVRKEGSSFDLAIAVSILCASGLIAPARLVNTELFGELGLDGTIKPVRGLLPLLTSSKDAESEVIVPAQNVAEARLIAPDHCVAVSSLREVLEYLCHGVVPESTPLSSVKSTENHEGGISLSDIVGQQKAKRALILAAAGAHNLLLVGPPGCGKSMLAERLPQLLPALSHDERLETVKIASICGEALVERLSGRAPFRAPHHTVSDVALTGGGAQLRPGEASLAHRGVLFLDEFPEYRRSALEALRAPLETGRIRVVRARGSVEYPANFQLIAAMNRCPCGRLGVPGTECVCSRSELSRYLGKLSQPILDRIDLQVDCEAVPLEAVRDGYLNRAEPEKPDEEAAESKEMVRRARKKQLKRQGCANSCLSGSALRAVIDLDEPAKKLLDTIIEKRNYSARRLVRIFRVSRTVADLEGRNQIEAGDISSAVSFMALSRVEDYVRGGVS